MYYMVVNILQEKRQEWGMERIIYWLCVSWSTIIGYQSSCMDFKKVQKRKKSRNWSKQGR